jgi:putative DNA methylase
MPWPWGGELAVPKRKLIEVALPLEAINRESAREKSIRHGHPSTLHLWWARRPLAACRAVLFAQLVDVPSSRPDLYPTEEAQDAKRQKLFELIEQLVKWENTTDETLLKRAHAEILASCDGKPPAILDPFAGGGSIPLEAQRLGLEAHASDLNPVAVLINKALIEIPPKWAGRPPVFPGAAESQLTDWPRATGLAEDVRRYGRWMRDEAEKRIGHLYPKAKLPDGTGANVIAWIWARTVTCPNPACSIEMPLVRSWWLGKKKGKEAWVSPRVVNGRVEFEIGRSLAGAPTKENDGTVTRNGAVCIACQGAVPLAYIRAEGKAKRIGARLMAIAADGNRQRVYLPPIPEHEAAADVPTPFGAPETELPHNPRAFTTPNYGMTRHADLFTPRQLTALITFSDLVREVRAKVLADARPAGLTAGEPLEQAGLGATAYADSIAVYLSLALSRTADLNNALTSWSSGRDQARNLFARQAISMVWDYVETMPFAGAAGDLGVSLDSACRVISSLPVGEHCQAVQGSASVESTHGALVSTDPPYYDNVPYADLADFFYVWVRRSLGDVLPSLLGTMLTPKAEELVADPFRRGSQEQADEFFEHGFVQVFERIRRDTPSDYPISVFYAFKQAETEEHGTASTGWEVLLEGMIRSGWEITATWPLRTERTGRMRDIDSNALASSIVLACRPRPGNAVATSRREFLGALHAELPSRLKELQQGFIAPVDLAQAAIGPGMAVFSRYSRVIEADGGEMTVRTALVLINQTLDEVLTEQEGDFDPTTRFAIGWYRQHGYGIGRFGDADNMARARNTAVDAMDRDGILTSRAGKVALYKPADLDADYDVLSDLHVSVWEAMHHLIRVLEIDGVGPTGDFLVAARSRPDAAVDVDLVKELAFLMFSIAEKNGWAKDALSFNALATSWADIGAASQTIRADDGQITLDFVDEED